MNIIHHLISVLTPYDCLFCGEEGLLVCASCRYELIEIIPSRCFICKTTTENHDTCSKCRNKTSLSRVFITTTYNKNIKKLIHKMKLASARDATKIIAQCMDENAPYYDDGVIVSFVPTVPSHVRQRGFNHTKLIAQEFARLRGLEYRELLSRCDNSKQVGKSRQQRLSQLIDVFSTNNAVDSGKSFLLIDDVTTTGATLTEATKTLKKSGYKNVEALVFAQTI